MTPDRRQSSPEHREMVHTLAVSYVDGYEGNYDDAAEFAQSQAKRWPTDAIYRDVASLLTRRAMTVKGATV